MKLSIIIPCYNAEPFIHELLDCLAKQMAKSVEVIVVDDGSRVPFHTDHGFVKVIRKENGGVSSARNMGIENATGEYIAFIDADDLVSDRYIGTILQKIKDEQFDYCYLSWKSKGSWQCDVKLNSIDDKFPPFNLCVWNRVYKRDLIGDTRFNTKKAIAEDAEFIRDIEKGKKAFISDYMYFYRSDTPQSLTKRFRTGELDTQRIVYHLPHITKDMTYLLDEVAKADKYAEVIILTDNNELPQLTKHAMVMKPCRIYGTELRGEPTALFSKIELPYKTQVVIYTARTFNIGGIETFIYNFCTNMAPYYDILVLYDEIDIEQLCRLKRIVECRKNDKKPIQCDTLLINRISDPAPSNVKFRQKVQMVHCCRIQQNWNVPQNNDVQIAVSQAVADSFAQDLKPNHRIINNMTIPHKNQKVLKLVSATRLGTQEKGKKRMKQLADALDEAGISYVWMCFSDQDADVPQIVTLKPRLNLTPFIKDADYLVQLSDSEAFCYSIVEALELGTAVITTPLPVLDEIGVIDGVNGYVVPFDMQDVDVSRFKHIPKFTFKWDNAKRIEQWREVLGDTIPTHSYVPSDLVECYVKQTYKDLELNNIIPKGTRISMKKDRAIQLKNAGVIQIL